LTEIETEQGNAIGMVTVAVAIEKGLLRGEMITIDLEMTIGVAVKETTGTEALHTDHAPLPYRAKSEISGPSLCNSSLHVYGRES